MKHTYSNTIFNTHTLSNRALLFLVFSLMTMTHAFALPAEITAIKSIADKIYPYLVWLFALGGGTIASVNGWRLFNGQPKAGVYALGGMVVSGLGFNGIFGDMAATLLI
jgi:hypothetical protein